MSKSLEKLQTPGIETRAERKDASRQEAEVGFEPSQERVEDREGAEKTENRLLQQAQTEVRALAKRGGEDSRFSEEKIIAYQKRFLPEHLREKAGYLARAIRYFWSENKKLNIETREELPKTGPFIVICNHFGGGDAEALLQAFSDADLHLGVAKNMWWESSPIIKWLLKKLRTLPIEESLSHLSDEQKEDALQRQDRRGKVVFRKIIERERQGKKAVNLDFLRQAVATLSRGDALGIFPEGLWLHPQDGRERKEMKQGYAGFEFIAIQYERLIGEHLPIIPTAFIEDRATGEKKLIVGKRIFLHEKDLELSGADWCMAHVAALLPEEQRGYYKEMVASLKSE